MEKLPKNKENIVQSAIALWAHDIEATLDDVASHANISRRTIHRHYQGRDDLVAHVMQYLLTNYSASISDLLDEEGKPLHQLKQLFYNDVKQAENYQLFTQLRKFNLPDTGYDKAAVNVIITRYEQIFQHLIAEKQVNDLMNVPWLGAFYSSLVDAAIKRIQSGGIAEDTLFIAWQTFYRGVKF